MKVYSEADFVAISAAPNYIMSSPAFKESKMSVEHGEFRMIENKAQKPVTCLYQGFSADFMKNTLAWCTHEYVATAYKEQINDYISSHALISFRVDVLTNSKISKLLSRKGTGNEYAKFRENVLRLR